MRRRVRGALNWLTWLPRPSSRGSVTDDTPVPIYGGTSLNLNPEVQQELSEFLMYELASTYEDFEDDSIFTLSIVANIAILGERIPESLMEMYLTPVKEIVSHDFVYGAAAYFHAAEILTIECDCSEYNPDCLVRSSEESDWSHLAIEHRESNHQVYNFAVSNVEALRLALA